MAPHRRPPHGRSEKPQRRHDEERDGEDKIEVDEEREHAGKVPCSLRTLARSEGCERAKNRSRCLVDIILETHKPLMGRGLRMKQWALLDLNQGPLACEASALNR